MIPLTAKKKNIEAHYNAVAPFILNRITKVLKDKEIRLGQKRDEHIPLSPWLEVLLDYLRTGENLRQIILADCVALIGLIDLIKDNGPDLMKKKTEDYRILFNIFINAGYNNINKTGFIEDNGVDTCPYCNRNYTFSAKNNVKPEIDHFYPSSRYPLLAASYFNLIPCCEPCNGSYGKHFKDSHGIGLVSPYLMTSADYSFSYTIKNVSVVNPIIGKSEIEVIINGSPRVAVNTAVFNLEYLYKLHADHVLELIVKKRVRYSEKYKQYLLTYKGLKLSKSEIDRMVLGNIAEEKHQHKRPLAKLYQDIGIELGLIRR